MILFSNTNIRSGLAEKTINGGVISIISQGILLILHFISLAILARLLTPEAFGIVAMVTAFTNLAVLFSDMGLSMATIQRKEISESEISSLFWANFLIGTSIAILLATIAPLLAKFYDQPEVRNIVIVSAIGFIFSSLTIQHEALLRRHLLLGRISLIHIVANMLSILVGITLALMEFGYWSLVLMTLSLSIFRMIGIWFVSKWIPRVNFNFKPAISYLKFGLNITGFNFINYFSRNLDKILIGKFVSVAALGEFTRVNQISLFPIMKVNGPLSASIEPALSRLQHNSNLYKEYYRNGIKAVSFIGTPIVFFLFIKAEEVTLLILGEQWVNSAFILQCLFPAALCAVTNTATGWVYNSLGHVNKQLNWGIFASLILCLAIIIGINWGVIGVALAISISRSILKIPGIIYCFSDTFLELSDFMRSFIPSLRFSILPSLAIYILGMLLGNFLSSALLLLLSLLVFSILYLIIIYLFERAFFDKAFNSIINLKNLF